jgi:hypothetical protein
MSESRCQPPDELRDVQLQNAKADQRFWEGLRSVHTDAIDKVVIAAAERAIANSEASAVNAAAHVGGKGTGRANRARRG